jgi:hypothetical protein
LPIQISLKGDKSSEFSGRLSCRRLDPLIAFLKMPFEQAVPFLKQPVRIAHGWPPALPAQCSIGIGRGGRAEIKLTDYPLLTLLELNGASLHDAEITGRDA